MPVSNLLLVILGLTAIAYYLGLRRSIRVAGAKGVRSLESLPSYYGLLTAVWCAVPALLVMLVWISAQDAVISNLVLAQLPADYSHMSPAQLTLVLNDIKNIAGQNIENATSSDAIKAAAEHYLSLQRIGLASMSVVVLSLAMLLTALLWKIIHPKLQARQQFEFIIKVFFLLSSLLAILTTVGIVLSVLFESIRFFHLVPISEFLFGLDWSPQIAIRADQQAASGAFGAVPLFVGTLLVSAIAMFVAVPIGLMSAIYLSEYADRKLRSIFKPMLEVLAGIPTVVYGVFAALTVAPFLRQFGESMGLDVASESALAAGLVMGIMIVPFVSSLSDDVINAVPQSLRDGAYSLGATQSETIRQVIIPAALPGIVGGILLAISRAIGETMIVVMAAGLSARLTLNPLEAVTTVTVQIVTLLVGDQEFDSAKTLAAFALGLMLFVVTLALNVIALHVVRRYREQYE
ncbi:MAG: phosphate ABC transporter permease subunit PstC [Gammaproteobacteria bacterium]|nr:phosphate ABC transporter permease subunit PstC [Gammaproteobacteria bacterium]